MTRRGTIIMKKTKKQITKVVATFGLSGVLVGGLTACNGKDIPKTTSNQEESEKADIFPETDENEKSITENTLETEAAQDFSYEDLAEVEFVFSSGAGAWCTTLQVESDGSFSGAYHDSNMGETGDGYPGGTCYISVFSGQFGELKKVNEYTYSTTIENIELEQEPGEEEILDEVKYISSEPYGVDNAEELLFYVKGAPVSELPEEYLSWVAYTYEIGSELPFYGLYNEAAEEGFAGETYSSDDEKVSDTTSIKEELKDLEQQASELEDKIDNQNLTQLEYNEAAEELYNLWDQELNVIWGILKDTLSEEEMAQLTEEEREWIKKKESEMEAAGAEYEGGSMQTMVVYRKGADLTKERVYELAEKLN